MTKEIITSNGFIQLHRKLLDWEWYQDTNTKVLFIHCLLKANYQEKNWRGMNIPRGSFVTSFDKLSSEIGLSVQQIRTAITKLKSTYEITSKSTNGYTVVTVVNYSIYQDSLKESNKQTTSESTNEQQTDNKRITTTNKDNKDNKIEKDNSIELSKKNDEKHFVKPTLEEVANYCFERRNTIDPQRFIDHYSSNGWKVGKNAMKDWKACVRTWEKNNTDRNKPTGTVGAMIMLKEQHEREEREQQARGYTPEEKIIDYSENELPF